MTLEERISQLEDIESIKQLKAKYCAACDNSNNPDIVTELFTDDGVWDGGDSLRAEGKTAIYNAFTNAENAISFSMHNVTNPIIEINGNNATGVWNLIGLITFASDGKTKLLSIRYDEEYVKIDGVWKIKLLKGQPRLMTSLDVLSWQLPK